MMQANQLIQLTKKTPT